MPEKAERPEYEEIPSIGQTAGAATGAGQLWPDLPRVSANALLGRVLVIYEARLMTSTLPERRGESFVVVRFTCAAPLPGRLDGEEMIVGPGEEATTAFGSAVVVDQLVRLLDADQFPVKCRYQKHPGKEWRELADV